MIPFQAWIIPISGQPPGIWGGGNQPFPTPPIHIPGQPPGIWGGGNEPFPGWGLPGNPGGGTGQPPGTWGGAGEPFPGYGLPGAPPIPTHPIVIPNPPGPDFKPEHPIVIPGAPAYPQNPTPATPGSFQPPTDLPGTGAVWVMGFFPGIGWRWVAVDAGAAGTGPKTTAK